MALNSAMHEIYLSMPIEANLMPELKGLPYWSRMTHEIMAHVNPGLISDLGQSGELEVYLMQQQRRLTSAARSLEREWRRTHPLSPQEDYLRRASWMNHSKQAAREILIEQLHQELKMGGRWQAE